MNLKEKVISLIVEFLLLSTVYTILGLYLRPILTLKNSQKLFFDRSINRLICFLKDENLNCLNCEYILFSIISGTLCLCNENSLLKYRVK